MVIGLAGATWVKAHNNLAIVGPTGAGKTLSVVPWPTRRAPGPHRSLPARPRMLDELAIAHVDGRFFVF